MTETGTETSIINVVEGRAVAVPGNDIDTDRIIPARYLRCVTFDGLGEHAFEDDRAQARAAGQVHPFDDPARRGARILLVNRNFGCGSSREHAPQALMRWGIAAVVGESFAEIFFGNCTANGVPCATLSAEAIASLMRAAQDDPATPFKLDLSQGTVLAGEAAFPVDMPPGPREQLLSGRWDTTRELLAAKDEVAQAAAKLPYFSGWTS